MPYSVKSLVVLKIYEGMIHDTDPVDVVGIFR